MKKVVFSVLFCLVFLHTPHAHASSCAQESVNTQYQKYASARSVYTNTFLLDIACTSSKEIAVTAGIEGSANTLVYAYGYQSDGSSWKQFSFSGAQKNGAWFVGSATSSLINTDTNGAILAYVCENIQGVWKCGCKDSICSVPEWQVREYGIPQNTTGKAQKTTIQKSTIPEFIGTYNAQYLTIPEIKDTDVFLGQLSSGWAAPGETLTLTGTNFSTTARGNDIILNDTPRVTSVQTNTSDTLTFTLPSSLPFGKYSLKVRAGGIVSTNELIFFARDTQAQTPSILSVSPATIQQGGTLTIRGNGFAKEKNTIITSFGMFDNIPSLDGTTLSFQYSNPLGQQPIQWYDMSGNTVSYTQPVYLYVANAGGMSTDPITFSVIQ